MPIKLIIGNPPSSDSLRSNVGTDFSIITNMMNDFRPPQEGRRARQNIQKQICNPHQQFLRWACDKLLKAHTHSVLSFVVPLSFLEAESYKYARKYLVENFTEAWIIAIDADARTGIRSNSLFHTLQGRAVIILTKKYNNDSAFSLYNFFDLTEYEMSEKIQWLEKEAHELLPLFSQNQISLDNYAFHPSKPFDEKLYESFWSVSGEVNQVAIFKNHCSGIKLAPTALFTHIKSPFLKRRSRDIAQNGQVAAEEWMGRQDKPPQPEKVVAFQNALNSCGSQAKMDSMLSDNIKPYSFRPFLISNVLLWQDVLKHYSKVGGGGTRLRPELIKRIVMEMLLVLQWHTLRKI